MLSALGHHRFDVAHRAVILGSVVADETLTADDLNRAAAGLAGADGLAVAAAPDSETTVVVSAVEALTRAFAGPIVVRTGAAEILRACLARGAVAGHDTSGLADPDYVSVAAESGASVIIGRPATAPVDPAARARGFGELVDSARAAGIPPERIAVDIARDPAGVVPSLVTLLEELPDLAAGGTTVFAHVAGTSDGPDEALRVFAAQALAVARGARLLVTGDVRGTRRVAVVMEELLRARADCSIDSGGRAR